MPVTNEQLKALAAPFPEHLVEFRVGHTSKDKNTGLALAYIDARSVGERLDTVCGPANWKVEYQATPYKDPVMVWNNQTNKKEFKGMVDKTGWLATISISVEPAKEDGYPEWVGKTDGSDATTMEPFKGGLSGAFKRAAVIWGIGRSLYSLPSVFVQLAPGGKQLAQTPRLPAWYMEGHQTDPALLKGQKPTAPIIQQEKPQAATAQPVKGVEPPADVEHHDPTRMGMQPPPITPEQVPEGVDAFTGEVLSAFDGSIFPENDAQTPFDAPQPSAGQVVANAAATTHAGEPVPRDWKIGFGKKMMSDNRSVKEYTWGEVYDGGVDSEVRGYVAWMAGKHQENIGQGKDSSPALEKAAQVMAWLGAQA